MVRQWQNLFCNSRYAQTDINDGLNLEFLSKAYGINYYKASDLDTLESILKVQDKSQINLIECLLDSDIGAYPIVPPGNLLILYSLRIKFCLLCQLGLHGLLYLSQFGS